VLAERGFVVYLHATLEEQLRRTRGDRNAPAAGRGDPEQVLRELFEIRDPLYREIADMSSIRTAAIRGDCAALLAQLP
jgi:shikimate kinase